MALIGNYSLLNRTAYRQFNTGISSQYFVCFTPSGALINRLYGGYNQKSASFIGYLHPVAYVLPMKPGAMGSLVLASGSISKLNTEMYAGRNLEGSGLEVLTLTNAQLDQIVALVANGILQIIQTNAGMAAAVGLDASGLLTLQTISAQLGGVFGISASGTLVLSSTNFMGALADMIAVAGGPTPLSPEGLAEAVWNYLKANPTISGSMKEVLEKAKLSADNAFAVSS